MLIILENLTIQDFPYMFNQGELTTSLLILECVRRNAQDIFFKRFRTNVVNVHAKHLVLFNIF